MTRDDSDRLRLQTLGKDTLIEVVSAYDELALGKVTLRPYYNISFARHMEVVVNRSRFKKAVVHLVEL